MLPTLVCITASEDTLSIFPSTWLHAVPVELISLHFFFCSHPKFFIWESHFFPNMNSYLKLLLNISGLTDCLWSRACSPALYYKHCTQLWHKEKWFNRTKLPMYKGRSEVLIYAFAKLCGLWQEPCECSYLIYKIVLLKFCLSDCNHVLYHKYCFLTKKLIM